MATDKPRVMITLDHATYQTVKRLAELNETPVSRVVSSLIVETKPVLDKLVHTLELAKQADADTRHALIKVIRRAEEEFSPLADQATNQLDLLAGELEALEKHLDS